MEDIVMARFDYSGLDRAGNRTRIRLSSTAVELHHQGSPWIEARQRVGNIAFAGTDASSNAMTESAIQEAYRSVHSLNAVSTPG